MLITKKKHLLTLRNKFKIDHFNYFIIIFSALQSIFRKRELIYKRIHLKNAHFEVFNLYKWQEHIEIHEKLFIRKDYNDDSI